MTNKNEWNEWKGLTEAEAAERRVRYGPNALPVPKHRLLRLIARQFRGIFNLMLLIAAGVTFSLGEPIDGAFILLFVFLGTALNVYQEHNYGNQGRNGKGSADRNVGARGHPEA